MVVDRFKKECVWIRIMNEGFDQKRPNCVIKVCDKLTRLDHVRLTGANCLVRNKDC